MAARDKRCFIHVGLPKTGTSFLQDVLRGSSDELRGQGVTMVPPSQGASTQLMYAVRERLVAGLDTEDAPAVLDRLRSQAGELRTPTALVTQEQLAPATPDQARCLVDLFPGFEVHVVVTTRGLARQIPSGWQERVKTRTVHPYNKFVKAVVNRGAPSQDFWRHQDLPEVLQRWARAVAPERVHVVTVPPAGADPNLLLARFCGLLDVDPLGWAVDAPRSNTSLGTVQAELLRRVNVALGDRLPHPRTGYFRAVRGFLLPKVLRLQSSQAPRLPSWTEPWCRTTVQQWIDVLDSSGFDIVGDLDELRPVPSDFVDSPQKPSHREIADAAVEALATVLDLRNHELAERDELRAELTSLRKRLDPGDR